ncbi:venom acid phosphatase Acph-1 [Onthophagus taurus]|uniref:venom acid phosphatase Acph-1 n=1 Tax=Onthophagus taurus TaxID=166361 RepID=UPI000C1FF8F9|nr:venom acid phosphatase Acph-1 [Onthophagus taurus]
MINLIGVIFLIISDAECESSMKSLHILFRHGERSPSKSYPLDPHKDYSWPGGWNQLTNRGKLEMYDCGVNIRKNYSLFLPKYYYPDDVSILSSYADRCQMSAQLFLAGLYPPMDDQIWNSDLLWQPIPLRSLPRSEDNKLALKKECPKYQQALKQAYVSPEIKNLNKKNKDLYKYLSENSGSEIENILKVETLYNILQIEQLNNLELPQWTKTVFPGKMKDLAAMSLAIFTQTDFMKKMHGGELVKEILLNIGNKINGTLSPNRKLFLYSGHDLTVVSLMRILGFNELIKPEFGASVIIEHHSINDKDIIKIFYKSNPYADLEEKNPNYCNQVCSFKEFVNGMKEYISENWDEDCKLA